MRIEVDTHTHTVGSGHSYSTLKENAQAARDKGLRGLVVTDHGPELPGAGPDFAIAGVLAHIPKMIEGVRKFTGTEANILDVDGSVDISERQLAATEFAVASLHSLTFEPSRDAERNTRAVLAALRNPWIDVIGHPGNPRYPIDYECFVETVGELGKAVEINNHSFSARPGSRENCVRILRLCSRLGVPVVVSSDAHSCYSVGVFGDALAVLEQEEFPEELVLNASLERFEAYVAERAKRNEQKRH